MNRPYDHMLDATKDMKDDEKEMKYMGIEDYNMFDYSMNPYMNQMPMICYPMAVQNKMMYQNPMIYQEQMEQMVDAEIYPPMFRDYCEFDCYRSPRPMRPRPRPYPHYYHNRPRPFNWFNFLPFFYPYDSHYDDYDYDYDYDHDYDYDYDYDYSDYHR